MPKFSLIDGSDYYLALSEQPKRFDANSPVTNVFFDDTNGEVFTVRSGGVTGVTVTGMDDTATSFRMEDRGPIISIKFSPDHKILAIQRNLDNQNATVEFVNFKDLVPTNVEYTHTCKWKNAKILGFVWPRVNEIAFITDHGIELLQVMPEKKQLKSLKNTSFSGAWFAWCASSGIVVLAGNNGALLQPFALNGSTITKLHKLELESGRLAGERDVCVVRLNAVTWSCVCAQAGTAQGTPEPNEVWLHPLTGSGPPHVLKTGLVGRFAVHVVDELIVVHHQSSQTSQVFDIMEESNAPRCESTPVIHLPIVPAAAMRPALVGDTTCPMYSVNWAVFQPHYIIDARLGCLWRVHLIDSGLPMQIPKADISKIVAVLLRRSNAEGTIYAILNQLVANAKDHLLELSQVFDEVNLVYRQWADEEMSRVTAGSGGPIPRHTYHTLISQSDCCDRVLAPRADDIMAVQVVTAYVASLSRHNMVVQHPVGELMVRVCVTKGQSTRLRALVRRGCLGDARTLACQLLSLGHMDPTAAQLALDMMARMRSHEEIVEILLSWHEPIAAVGAARASGVWAHLSARKLLAVAKQHAETNGPGVFVAVYHALTERNERARGSPGFTKNEQCDSYVEYYKQITAE